MAIALASTLVAVAAVITAVLTTRLSLRHARTLDHDRRLWEKRADAYVDVLIWLPLLSEKLELGGHGRDRTYFISHELDARISAFSSVAVIAAVEGFLDVARRYSLANSQGRSVRPDGLSGVHGSTEHGETSQARTHETPRWELLEAKVRVSRAIEHDLLGPILEEDRRRWQQEVVADLAARLRGDDIERLTTQRRQPRPGEPESE